VIHGYVVVRKPPRSFDERQRLGIDEGPPCCGEVCYNGLDRMPWFDINEASYASQLPAHLRELRRQMDDANADRTGVTLWPREEAFEALRFSNRADHRCELIAISSDLLAQAKDLVGQPDDSVEWLGYDVVLMGGWSLISDWIFRSPGGCDARLEKVNKAGLLDSPLEAPGFVADYQTAVERGEAEEIPGPEWIPMTLRVGRVMIAPGGRSD
jgi:hypothetical protein